MGNIIKECWIHGPWRNRGIYKISRFQDFFYLERHILYLYFLNDYVFFRFIHDRTFQCKHSLKRNGQDDCQFVYDEVLYISSRLHQSSGGVMHGWTDGSFLGWHCGQVQKKWGVLSVMLFIMISAYKSMCHSSTLDTGGVVAWNQQCSMTSHKGFIFSEPALCYAHQICQYCFHWLDFC